MRLTYFSREQREKAVFESREKQIFSRYKLGAWVKGFAWLPVRIDPKTVVWLERFIEILAGASLEAPLPDCGGFRHPRGNRREPIT